MHIKQRKTDHLGGMIYAYETGNETKYKVATLILIVALALIIGFSI